MKQRTLIAERALLHPLWVLSLVVLLVNDHQLKGADILPGWLTGKLSDLAGYFLFPMLLASAVRVTTRAGAALAHLASAGLLLLLELSPAACALVERTIGWRMWADPTDLIALGSIALSWRVLVPAAERAEPLRLLLSRSLAVVGGLASVATSRPPTTERLPQQAEAFLWNRTTSEFQVRIKAPRQDVLFSCDDVASIGPGAIFAAEEFRVVRNVLLVVDGRLTLDGLARGECTVLLVEVEGAGPRLLAWKTGSHALVDIANNPGITDGIQIEQSALARSVKAPGWMKSEALGTAPLVVEPGCAPPPQFSDLAWSTPLPGPNVSWTVLAISRGADGCDELSLQGSGGGDPHTWFVCIDPLPLPFVVGDVLDFRPAQGVTGPSVVVQSPTTILTVVAGAQSGAALTESTCRPVAHGCVAGTMHGLLLGTPAGSIRVESGAIKMVKDRGWDVTVRVARAERIHVANEACDANAKPGEYQSYAWVATKEMP